MAHPVSQSMGVTPPSLNHQCCFEQRGLEAKKDYFNINSEKRGLKKEKVNFEICYISEIYVLTFITIKKSVKTVSSDCRWVQMGLSFTQ